MANSPLQDAIEVFSAPIEGVIVALGKGIAEAQAALDRNSIQTQEAYDSDPQLAPYGLQATWYQFPRVDLQLKLAMTVTEDRTSTAQAAAPQHPIALASKLSALRLVAQPASAAFQNHFNYDAQAASTITLSILPVPPPRAADQSTVQPQLNPASVQSIALASSAGFSVVKGPDGNPLPSPDLRFLVNFNAPARLWYVLQFDPANSAAQPVVVTVDDATRTVRIISKK
jgi:hypothetical protein